nr:immunoglobulin light chain junction region [Macaca mulatta]MOV61815.1 immunoglobulin light chain junction region [Macaca mulatta]MOV61915.1 immunoglobulin light chain junction region [Macaca mulatta]MOV62218.1 immunoglobulin light chain junction region [Macaca mulatta]MOV62581.1 immunoglobulin light chain junction region [Macaca mulatta]
CLQSKNSPYSF